jgi:hypothetical protein
LTEVAASDFQPLMTFSWRSGWRWSTSCYWCRAFTSSRPTRWAVVLQSDFCVVTRSLPRNAELGLETRNLHSFLSAIVRIYYAVSADTSICRYFHTSIRKYFYTYTQILLRKYLVYFCTQIRLYSIVTQILLFLHAVSVDSSMRFQHRKTWPFAHIVRQYSTTVARTSLLDAWS